VVCGVGSDINSRDSSIDAGDEAPPSPTAPNHPFPFQTLTSLKQHKTHDMQERALFDGLHLAYVMPCQIVGPPSRVDVISPLLTHWMDKYTLPSVWTAMPTSRSEMQKPWTQYGHT